MSGYLFGLFWNNGEHFEFSYTEKYNENQIVTNTNKFTENILEELKKKTLHIEIHNVQLNEINKSFCDLNIESILFTKCKISSLENLKFIKNLKKITITDSEIGNINALAESNLEYLSVFGSNVKLDQINKLKNLRELYYKSNLKIDTELINLENLENLLILNLNDNNITNINNIGLLKNLISIDIGNNKINSIDVFNNYTKLKYVYVNMNNISDLNSIKNNKDIKFLNIANNNISNIEFITDFKNLEALNLSHNPITVIPNLLLFKNLDYDFLKIDWKNVKDLQVMKGYELIKNIITSFAK
jgi:hypothetical protein